MTTFSLKKISSLLKKAGLQERSEQLALIESVHHAISHQKILCAEAPTGTGKTLAYCLGALMARKPGQTIVMSTATTALQDQFLNQDLPIIEKVLNETISVSLAKGRRRYVCHARLLQEDRLIPLEEYTVSLEELRKLIQTKKWQGERDQLTKKVSESLWQEISTDSSGCLAGRCEYYDECAFFKNRRNMHHADIVVTNHNLLLADLELGGGALLPEIKNTIYILDECHHFPEKALSHFANQSAVIRSIEWINLIGKTLSKSEHHIKLSAKTSSDLNQITQAFVETLWNVKYYLDGRKEEFLENQLRVVTVDEILLEHAKQLIQGSRLMASKLSDVLSLLEAYAEKLDVNKKEMAQQVAQLIGSLSFILDRAEKLGKTWESLVINHHNKSDIPHAVWFERKKTIEDEMDYTCHTSPINVSQAMQNLFWDKAQNGIVLCSATIRALGRFDDFLRKTGLKNNERTLEKTLTSPFEYHHSLLYVPTMQVEPNMLTQGMHNEEVIEWLQKLILPRNGTLILFTSRKVMEQVYFKMPGEIKKDSLIQDDYNKAELIKRHKIRIDRGHRSIIFGLASLAEGIDLAGHYCEHVIIQKIPFSVPSDPIAKTRAEWLKKHEGDPFKLISLPEVSIKLAQFIGRLLRHENDQGVVTILDKRLYTKYYGAELLKSLPPFTQLINQSLEEFQQHILVKKLFSLGSVTV